MVASVRPTNESTMSSAADVDDHAVAAGGDDPLGQVLLQAQRDLVLHVDLDRDEEDVADLEDRNAFHVSAPGAAGDAARSSRSTCRSASASDRLGGDVAELDAERDDGLGDLRADAGDDALGAHQPGGHHGLQDVLGDLGVHRRDAGDVDDRVRRAGVDQRLQQPLHHHLGAGRVQRADQRHRDDAVPELHHRGGQLEQLLGLVGDQLLAGPDVAVEGEQRRPGRRSRRR